jgi:hypothetical protein
MNLLIDLVDLLALDLYSHELINLYLFVAGQRDFDIMSFTN